SYRTISEKLKDYGSKHTFRIYSDKNLTSQHLKLLSRIALRQESDHLNAGDNYAIGDIESEESSSKSDHNLELKSKSSDDDDRPSQEEDKGIPDLKDTDINNSKKWKLPSGLYVGEIFDENVSASTKKFSAEDTKFMAKSYADLLKVPQLLAKENSFISKVESMVLKGDVNGAYKLCIENYVDSEENGYMHKISKIYAEFIYRSKNKVDILDYAGDTHTELDVIMKAFGYIIEGLNSGFEIHQKWSARVNQSIMNGLLNLNITDEQSKNIKVPFVQVCGTSGQMLIEDLVEGFYVVFPGPKFELPTRLQHIKKLKSAVNTINFIM
ncbi:15784_t:CDS:2, partial [Funneliformis mosseae]